MNANNYFVNMPLDSQATSGGATSPFTESNDNWGVEQKVAPKVVMDPQVNAYTTNAADDEARTELRRARRRLMADLAEEFAASNDTLLRNLAR